MFDYDVTAVPELKTSIEEITEFCTRTKPQFIDDLEQISHESGADKFIKNVNVVNTAISTLSDLFKDFIGEEGESVLNGTLCSYVRAAQKLNGVLN